MAAKNIVDQEKNIEYVSEIRIYIRSGKTMYAHSKFKSRSDAEAENDRVRKLFKGTVQSHPAPTLIEVNGDLVLSTAIEAATFHIMEHHEDQ